MFITPERVELLTGYTEITLSDVARAQAMLEANIGKMEARIRDADDLEIMAKATAYQTVYLKADTNRVYEMAQVDQLQQESSSVAYKGGDYDAPFIAPLAKMAMRHLSWRKSHSIGFGGIIGRRRNYDGDTHPWKRDLTG